MEESGLLESDYKVILLFEKAQKVVISITIHQCYNFVGAVAHELPPKWSLKNKLENHWLSQSVKCELTTRDESS